MRKATIRTDEGLLIWSKISMLDVLRARDDRSEDCSAGIDVGADHAKNGCRATTGADAVKSGCSRAVEGAEKPINTEENGRHEETRTPDLYRVKVAL